jgi:hypothetical protein
MRFGKLETNPVLSPGILDTATWDRAAAVAQIHAVDTDYWPNLSRAVQTGLRPPQREDLTAFAWSRAWRDGVGACLASLRDGQRVFFAFGADPQGATLGSGPLVVLPLPNGETLAAYPTDAAVVDRFVRAFVPRAGPIALGRTPRLGVGTRMTTAVWPAIWDAMRQGALRQTRSRIPCAS